MCHSIEDCLVSKIGFRLFITIIGLIVCSVIFINAHYALSGQPVTPEVTPSESRTFSGLNQAISSAIVRDTEPHHVTIGNDNHRTNILFWTDDHTGNFFNRLSKEIVYLRHAKNGCSSLQHCAFSSDQKKLLQADAVVVAAKNLSTLDKLPILETKTLPGMRPKLWTLLFQDPSYHEAFIKAQADPSKFDILVSYLPNSTLPLAKVKFQTKEGVFGLQPKQKLLKYSPKKNLPLHIERPLKLQSDHGVDRIAATIMV